MTIKTEQDIMQNWSVKESPVVSICCITYNHEKYIGDAINSFLMQETDFPFEILIHDDASTDNTADIVREYAAIYPNLIKPIYQNENQLSQGKRINPEFNFTRANGEYLALCEGDDCWISKNKLKKQYWYMKNHKSIALSFHDVEIVDENNELISLSSDRYKFEHGRLFDTKDIIKDWFICTPTIMLKKKSIDGMEPYFTRVINGDWSFQLVCSIKGEVCFIENLLSCYRKHSASFSAQIGKDRKYRAMKLIKLFNRFDAYSNFQYQDDIEKKVIFYLDELIDFEVNRRLGKFKYIVAPKKALKRIYEILLGFKNAY